VKSLVGGSDEDEFDFITDFTEEQAARLVGVPKEFHKLCSRLDNVPSPKTNKEIFLKNPPSMEEAARVRNALDTHTIDDELPISKLVSQHGIAEQLLIFLSVLPERIIPQTQYTAIVESADAGIEQAAACLAQLPTVHRQCFLRLIRTLRLVLDNQDANTLSMDFVSTLFNSLLFVPPAQMAQEHNYDWERSKKLTKQFLLYYLEGQINLNNCVVVNTSTTTQPLIQLD
jgi:hypothetical protein